MRKLFLSCKLVLYLKLTESAKSTPMMEEITCQIYGRYDRKTFSSTSSTSYFLIVDLTTPPPPPPPPLPLVSISILAYTYLIYLFNKERKKIDQADQRKCFSCCKIKHLAVFRLQNTQSDETGLFRFRCRGTSII